MRGEAQGGVAVQAVLVLTPWLQKHAFHSQVVKKRFELKNGFNIAPFKRNVQRPYVKAELAEERRRAAEEAENTAAKKAGTA